MKAVNIVFKLAVLLAALAAGYAFGFSRGGGEVREKPADIAAMRMALAQKQAQVAELSAEIWLEERHLNAEEEADYRWIHGDAEVPEGKELESDVLPLPTLSANPKAGWSRKPPNRN